MSEREEVSRFDFEHPPCKGYGCCGGGGMAQYEDGEFVRYTDYAVVQKERDVWEREAVDGRAVLAHHKARSDEMHRLWTAAIAELEKCDAERITAERERDEARRDVARLHEEAKERLEQWSGVYESARHRAERAERVVEAAKVFRAVYEADADMPNEVAYLLDELFRALDASGRGDG